MKASSLKKKKLQSSIRTRINCYHCRGFYPDLQVRREPQEVVAGEAKEGEGEEVTEGVEVQASEEEGVGVVSEGEDVKRT